MKKKHAVFMPGDATYQPRVKESHVADELNNLANAVTLYAINLTKLTLINAKLKEQLKV